MTDTTHTAAGASGSGAPKSAATDPRVKKLLAELDELIEQGDHLDALDVYEELDRLTPLTPTQLMQMGHSYLAVRRKTDARDAWIRAWKIDPNFKEAAMELNRNFPGWRKEAPRIQAYGSSGAPAGRTELGIGPGGGAGGAAGGGEGGKAAPAAEDKKASAPARKPAISMDVKMAVGVSGDNAVNWDYILADVEAARAEQGKHRQNLDTSATPDASPI